MEHRYMWYTIEDLQAVDDVRKVAAMASMMWGNCIMEKAPEYFSEWMRQASEKMGISPAPENVSAKCQEIIASFKK
jgi:flavorubredoxin